MSENQYISFLAPHIEGYAKYLSTTNKWEPTIKKWLKNFDHYCDSFHDKTLRQEHIDSWSAKRTSETNASCGARVSKLNGFLRYLIDRNIYDISLAEVPKHEKYNNIPYFFSQEELIRFFRECDSIEILKSTREQKNRKMTTPVIFRLLYSTGMRPPEVRGLRRKDVDLTSGVISISETKGHIEHHIIMHETMSEVMLLYDKHIRILYPERKYFFPGYHHEYLTMDWLSSTFRNMWTKANGWSATHPVVYTFRHNYAIENINSWTGNASDSFSKLVILSKSMGHANLKSTMYYYSLCPKLSEIIEIQTGDKFNEIIPEVQHE